MTRQATWTRRAAATLAAVAGSLLEPTARREWGRAMRAEIDHIAGDYAALRWACGCAFAAITLRRTHMDLGTLRVSRFVLALEMLLCFFPMTFGWIDIVVGSSGVAWLDPASIQRYYLGTTEGVAALTKMFAGALIGVLGPLGLIIAVRYIVFGRALQRGWVSSAMIAGPIVLGIVYVTANLADDTRWWPAWIGFYVMFVALPAIGAAHLLHLGRSRRDSTLAAA